MARLFFPQWKKAINLIEKARRLCSAHSVTVRQHTWHEGVTQHTQNCHVPGRCPSGMMGMGKKFFFKVLLSIQKIAECWQEPKYFLKLSKKDNGL